MDVLLGVGFPLGVSEGVAAEERVVSPGPLGVTLVEPEAAPPNDKVGRKGVPDTVPVERWWVGVALSILPTADLVGGALVGVIKAEPLGISTESVGEVEPVPAAPEEAELAREGEEDTEVEGDTLPVNVPSLIILPAPEESEGEVEGVTQVVGVAKAWGTVGVPAPSGDTVACAVTVTPIPAPPLPAAPVEGEMEGEAEAEANPVALPSLPPLLPEEEGEWERQEVRVTTPDALLIEVADLDTVLLCVDCPMIEAVAGDESVLEGDRRGDKVEELVAAED